MYNPEIETATRSEMESIQLTRLQQTVKRVFENVPFYQEKFKEHGITPEDITSLEDVRKLPFTKKKDLRDNYQNMISFAQKSFFKFNYLINKYIKTSNMVIV